MNPTALCQWFGLRVLERMTLQWAAVALFLYAEIAFLLILCLPLLSAQRSVCLSLFIHCL